MKGRTSLEHHLIDNPRCALASAGRREGRSARRGSRRDAEALGDEVAAQLSGGLHQNDACSTCATIASSSW